MEIPKFTWVICQILATNTDFLKLTFEGGICNDSPENLEIHYLWCFYFLKNNDITFK